MEACPLSVNWFCVVAGGCCRCLLLSGSAPRSYSAIRLTSWGATRLQWLLPSSTTHWKTTLVKLAVLTNLTFSAKCPQKGYASGVGSSPRNGLALCRHKTEESYSIQLYDSCNWCWQIDSKTWLRMRSRFGRHSTHWSTIVDGHFHPLSATFIIAWGQNRLPNQWSVRSRQNQSISSNYSRVNYSWSIAEDYDSYWRKYCLTGLCRAYHRTLFTKLGWGQNWKTCWIYGLA